MLSSSALSPALWWTLSLVLMAGALLPQAARAWSEAGHMAIAELAVRKLAMKERDYLNDLAATLIEQNPNLQRRGKRYGTLSPLALTSAWLDQQRGLEVAEIFKRYGHRVPQELAPYARSTTDDWHYSNRLYKKDGGRRDGAVSAGKACDNHNSGELNAVLPRLKEAFASAEQPEDKAIVLAIFVHLVGDAHQPLHSVTRATGNCQHDRGGNAFCAVKGGGRCEKNLHQLWDAGFGAFDGALTSNLAVIDRATQYYPPSAGVVLQPDLWQAENYSSAESLYATEEGKPPDAEYKTWARELVRQRADLAAERLAQMLGAMVPR